MVPVTGVRGWDFDVERGPDSLFVHPYRLEDDATLAPPLAEQIWALLEQNLTHRLVLELNDIGHLNSHLLSELVSLHKRIHGHDGMMRICGLSSNNEKVLEQCHLSGYLPHFRNREEAVMGQPRPKQPR